MKVIVFKGMLNPIPDIFKVNANIDEMQLGLLKDWDGYHGCTFITEKNKIITYGAGQIRKMILKEGK